MFTYNKMQEYFHGKLYDDSKEGIVSRILNTASKIVEEKDIKLFYPKNMFVDEKVFELYLLCQNNRILKISEENDNLIVTNFYSIDNINKFVLKENYKNDSEKILEIKFKDGECFIFNSYNDTNEHHRRNLASVIEEICKSVILYKNQNLANGEM